MFHAQSPYSWLYILHYWPKTQIYQLNCYNVWLPNDASLKINVMIFCLGRLCLFLSSIFNPNSIILLDWLYARSIGQWQVKLAILKAPCAGSQGRQFQTIWCSYCIKSFYFKLIHTLWIQYLYIFFYVQTNPLTIDADGKSG